MTFIIVSLFQGFYLYYLFLVLNVYDKIKKLVKLRRDWSCSFEIEVDGGVNLDNVGMLAQVGVDIAVVGSAVFGPGEPGERLQQLRHQVTESQAHLERRK